MRIMSLVVMKEFQTLEIDSQVKYDMSQQIYIRLPVNMYFKFNHPVSYITVKS